MMPLQLNMHLLQPDSMFAFLWSLHIFHAVDCIHATGKCDGKVTLHRYVRCIDYSALCAEPAKWQALQAERFYKLCRRRYKVLTLFCAWQVPLPRYGNQQHASAGAAQSSGLHAQPATAASLPHATSGTLSASSAQSAPQLPQVMAYTHIHVHDQASGRLSK